MDQYAEVIGENGTIDDYQRVALYYERTNNYFKAGVFFLKCLDYKKVNKYFNSTILMDCSILGITSFLDLSNSFVSRRRKY